MYDHLFSLLKKKMAMIHPTILKREVKFIISCIIASDLGHHDGSLPVFFNESPKLKEIGFLHMINEKVHMVERFALREMTTKERDKLFARLVGVFYQILIYQEALHQRLIDLYVYHPFDFPANKERERTFYQINYLSFFLLTLFSISFISCSDDDDNKLNTGITNQSWTEGKSLEISQDNELSVSFNAAAKWVASVTSGADWCKLNTTSGTKGQSTLKLSVSTSSTTDRTARISINIDGYSPASFEVTQKGTSVPQTTEDMEINVKVDEYLREMYLWNDEYKTLNLDHNKGYEDFFYDALGSMTTNTLDKKTYVGSDGKTYYNLFSYIQLLPNISSTRTTKIDNSSLFYLLILRDYPLLQYFRDPSQVFFPYVLSYSIDVQL